MATAANGESPTDVEQNELPNREDLLAVIEEQQNQIDRMSERIDELEAKMADVEFEATTVQEVAESLKEGKIGGEAGAEFIQQFIEVPDHGSQIDARTTQLFLKIIRKSRVGTPVTSSDVVKWMHLKDSSNPSVQARRIMERLKEHREDGFYLGDIELQKHRGQNCLWIGESP